jgi:hypothetical protein
LALYAAVDASCQAQPQKWLYGVCLPNRYLAPKVRLVLDAVEADVQA